MQLILFIIPNKHPPILLDSLRIIRGNHDISVLLFFAISGQLNINLHLAVLLTDLVGNGNAGVFVAEFGHVLDLRLGELQQAFPVFFLHVHEVGDILDVLLLEGLRHFRGEVRDLKDGGLREPQRLDDHLGQLDG